MMAKVPESLSVISILLVLALAGCSGGPGSSPVSSGTGMLERPKDNSPVPVTVAKVVRSNLPVELHAIGTGHAYKTVSVESQVAAIVKEVHYQQGQFVRQGDLLVTLDNSPFLATLAQAQAALAKDQAQVRLDEAELQRYDKLHKQGLVSDELSEQYVASSSAAVATLHADEAAVQTAKIQLSYCSIYAPISGVTGAQLVYPGATVKANDVPALVVINQVSPIYVSFAVPQQYLESIKSTMERSSLAIQATPTGDSKPENGVLTFINNTVDTTTGTINLMGSFPNTDQLLWPGQFSNVVLRLGEQQNVLVVPSQAIQTGQQGDYAFVVKPDKTVDVRQVNVGQTVGGQTEVLKGLAPGETVVTDGQVRLVPGSKVYFSQGL